MVYEGYISFGGNEIVNSERTRGYAESGDCPVTWFDGDRCEGLNDALGHEEYDVNSIPLAPWYDISLPEISSRFYGVHGLALSGLQSSTRSADTTEGIDDGGVVGRTRKGVRAVRARAVLTAKGRDALDYGISWLSSALDPGACGQHGTECGTTDMEFFTDCPPARGVVNEYSEWSTEFTNLATNPSYETSGGTSVEVRRNYFRNIRLSATGATGWEFARTGLVVGSVATGLEITQETQGTGDEIMRPQVGSGYPQSLTGDHWSTSWTVENSGALPVTVWMRMYNLDTDAEVLGAPVTIAPGAVSDVTCFDWAAGVGPILVSLVGPDMPIGASIIVHDAPLLEKAKAVVEPRFAPWIPHPDEDLTSSWVGAVNASESILAGTSVAGITSTASQARVYRTTDRPDAGLYALRAFIMTTEGVGIRVSQAAPVAGVVYTLIMKARSSRSGTLATPRIAGNNGPSVALTNEWQEIRLTITAGTGNAVAQTGLLFSPSAGHQYGDLVDIDSATLVEGEYPGPTFDGATEPESDLVRYAWSGAADASTSTRDTRQPIQRPQTDEEYTATLQPYRRFLHDVAATSGPLLVEIFESKLTPGVWGAIVEWTITSERPWIYSTTRPVDLAVTPTTVIQDIPLNLNPYPSAELAGAAVVVSTNYSTNPSVETNATNWTGYGAAVTGSSPTPFITSGRVTGELQAAGTSSFRTRLVGSGTAASGRSQLLAAHLVPINVLPAGSRFSISVWGAMLVLAGASVTTLRELRAFVTWSGGPGRTDVLDIVTDPGEFGGHVFTAKSIIPPTGTIQAAVTLLGEFDWASGATNSDVRMYCDAVAVTIP